MRKPRWSHLPGLPGILQGKSRFSVACMLRESPSQPECTAIYCLSSTMNEVGGARMPELVGNSQNSLPVATSKA